MAATNYQLEFEGMEELQNDMLHAAAIAPKELNKSLTKISRQFLKNMKKRAEGEYQTTENITSGMYVDPVKSESYQFHSYFRPEKRGNKAHHWHLQEEGYELTTPLWLSRKKAIRNSNGGKIIKFIPGRHLVDQEVPSFTEFMGREAQKALEQILKESNL